MEWGAVYGKGDKVSFISVFRELGVRGIYRYRVQSISMFNCSLLVLRSVLLLREVNDG